MPLFDVLALYPSFTFISALILGLLVGSFLNVVIYRLPKMMEAEWREQCQQLIYEADHLVVTESEQANISLDSTSIAKKETFNLCAPRSSCPHCGHNITALENIPIISYVFLGGKCSACKNTISLRYPSVELVTGVLSALAIAFFGATWAGLAALVLTWALIALTMIDLDTYLLPDDITLPLLWLGLIVNSFGLFTDLASAFWGAVAGYLTLWSVYQLFKLLTGKEGMGYGDFKLLAALGAWMGWQMLPQIILLSSLVGAVIGITLIIVRGRDRNIPIPFGPYLAIAGWIAFLWGDRINATYLKIFVPS
ncbi:prepilin peptidase [Cellvibrio japonicus]|uniref:Prepilin leader peptidase/N-methyltransferase n=1 Tax=Cellvibrio japonicus (strain Ueda107) TaxID=498211 RepID=B3PBG5_CELJU|nr:A24 family peptidase [Cellvibrio japonicus]ACE85364.1 type IV pilus prepilin peptidase PilD [Cellvibrio japonicus Ueda107]QEI13081.1 prepilin peptidase [Cellvibrio japonicus]QEI16655.1 prepilin peptidase [Cellvibrio japonicus]QEI20233.1 prepilin peptidase [Cellvibrio japonicus]